MTTVTLYAAMQDNGEVCIFHHKPKRRSKPGLSHDWEDRIDDTWCWNYMQIGKDNPFPTLTKDKPIEVELKEKEIEL